MMEVELLAVGGLVAGDSAVGGLVAVISAVGPGGLGVLVGMVEGHCWSNFVLVL